MKRVLKLKLIAMVLIALVTLILTSCKLRSSDSTVAIEIANPASIFCQQKGNTLNIVTAADGSQSGVCVFPDGSSCDEWAYFKGECGPSLKLTGGPTATLDPTLSSASGGYMQPGTSESFADWWGVIKSAPSGSQYDDYFERQDLGGAINFGIDSLDPEINTQIEALRDSGQIVHLYGTLFSNVDDFNGSQVMVDRIVIEE